MLCGITCSKKGWQKTVLRPGASVQQNLWPTITLMPAGAGTAGWKLYWVNKTIKQKHENLISTIQEDQQAHFHNYGGGAGNNYAGIVACAVRWFDPKAHERCKG